MPAHLPVSSETLFCLQPPVNGKDASSQCARPHTFSPTLSNLSAGGTESILLAVKASRDYMVEQRGITHPEMVVGPSAHAAYWKASEYFNIKLVIAPLGKDLRCAPALSQTLSRA